MTHHDRDWIIRFFVCSPLFLVSMNPRMVYGDPIPARLFVTPWDQEAERQNYGEVIWTTYWGHEMQPAEPPPFAVFRDVDEDRSTGIVWLHVTSADNVRELVAISVQLCRSLRFAFHDRSILDHRIGSELFQPEQVVFFIHDDSTFERSHAFRILASELFDLESEMEQVLNHVVVLSAASPSSDGDPHSWIHGDCRENSLDRAFPLAPAQSRTLTPPTDAFQTDTLLGAEFTWDPVCSGFEPWDIGRMTWGARFYDNYCEYERHAATGDLLVCFHYCNEICPEAQLRDVIEYMYRYTRYHLMPHFAGNGLHPILRSVRASTEFPAPGRVVFRIANSPFIAMIPADVLFAPETSVERALASTWLFRHPNEASDEWAESLNDLGIDVVDDEEMEAYIEPVPERRPMM